VVYAPLFKKYPYTKKYPERLCYPSNLGAVDLERAIFRGAAPNHRGRDPVRVLQCLKRKGVRNVLILNQTEQNVSVEEEIEVIEAVGLHYERFDWAVIAGEKRNGREPTWKRIKELLLAGAAYVHCVWGADRTGAIVGRLRREFYKWPKKDCQYELSSYGWALGGTIPRDELQRYQKDVLAYFDCPVSLYEPLSDGRNS